VNFDEQVKPAERDAGESDGGMSRRSFLSGATCEACLAEECSTQVAACDADAFCSEWLRTAKALETPRVATPSGLSPLWDEHWNAKHGDADATAVDDFRQCRDRCRDACQLGRDFSCAGQFDWPASYPKHTRLRAEFQSIYDNTKKYANVRVQACLDESDCVPALGDAVSDERGLVDLAIDLTRGNSSLVDPEFYGLLRVDAGEHFSPVEIFSSAPWFDRFFNFYNLTTKDEAVAFLGKVEMTPDTARGGITVQAYDCNAIAASGLHLEFWRRGRDVYAPCEDCSARYTRQLGLPDVALTQLTPPANLALGYAEGPVVILARDVESGHVVSVMRDEQYTANQLHFVFMYPASREELKRLRTWCNDPDAVDCGRD
jgi:hypothetical protein